MSKPLVLVAYTSSYQQSFFARLKTQYSFLFCSVDFAVSVREQAHAIRKRLRDENAPVDGVVGVGDEGSILGAVLARELELPGPDPHAMYRAQHKGIFSRLAAGMETGIPTSIIAGSGYSLQEVSYPVFIKPVKSMLSQYAYLIRSEKQFVGILNRMKNKHIRHTWWFDTFFRECAANLKDDYISLDQFIVQPFIEARQYTADAFVQNGQVAILGITKSVFGKNRRSFVRFDFPGDISKTALSRVNGMAQAIVRALGYDNAGCNIEFFLTSDDRVLIIEFNTRQSIQFVPLFTQKYEQSTVSMMIDIALGKAPSLAVKKDQTVASSCVLRRDTDALVTHIPTKKTLDRLAKTCGVLGIRILAEKGKRLSDYTQDSYSYRYAIVDIAGKNLQEIKKKLACVIENLGIRFG